MSDQPLPAADLYCLGGGEDGPQVRAARSLRDDGMLARQVANGAAVLAVCAGYQIVGTTFPGAEGDGHDGVGLLDISTVKGTQDHGRSAKWRPPPPRWRSSCWRRMWCRP